jgi:hypothetical protein
MLSELLADTRKIELELAERTIAYRLELERTKKVERLERELAVARARAADVTRPVRAS